MQAAPAGQRIGFNATLVLVVLLLAVPLQLFLNHYLNQSYTTPSAKGGMTSAKEAIKKEMADTSSQDEEGIDEVRKKAMERLSTTMLSVVEQFQATFKHYSSWQNLKQLFVIPYKRKVETTTKIHLSTLDYRNNDNIKISISGSSKKLSKAQNQGSGGQSSSKSKQGSSSTSASSQSSLKVAKKKKVIEEAPTSRAKEVEEYLMKEVYFSQSKTPRTTRPSSVEYFVGQVVKHKMDGYYGVIIGWDSTAKAPDWWLEKVYGKERKHLIQTPHYHMLVDSHFDASGTPYHYIPTEDLQPVDSALQISAPELSLYFEGYKNMRHTPRPWLREIYPLG